MRNNRPAPHQRGPGSIEVTDAVWVDFMGSTIVNWYKKQGLTAADVCKCARFDEDKPWLSFKQSSPKFAGETHSWSFESDPNGPCRGGFSTSFAWKCKRHDEVLVALPVEM